MTERNGPGGDALRALRVSSGLSLTDVARAAGASVSYLSRAENDQVTPRDSWIAMVSLTIGHLISQREQERAAEAAARSARVADLAASLRKLDHALTPAELDRLEKVLS